MKIKHLIAAITITGAVGTMALAQPGGPRGPGGPPPGGPGGNPIVEALDVDGNHELSSSEIQNASKSLAALDTNGDGIVSRDDMGPPGGGHGQGGAHGRRGQGGPRRPEADDAKDTKKVSKTYMKRLMKFDKDKSGTIEKDELPDRMQRVMTKADTNGDDVLDENELDTMLTGKSKRSAPQNAGHEEGGPGHHGGGPDPNRMVDDAMNFDADGDGKLSRTELLAFAESMPPPGGHGGHGGPGGPGGSGSREK